MTVRTRLMRTLLGAALLTTTLGCSTQTRQTSGVAATLQPPAVSHSIVRLWTLAEETDEKLAFNVGTGALLEGGRVLTARHVLYNGFAPGEAPPPPIIQAGGAPLDRTVDVFAHDEAGGVFELPFRDLAFLRGVTPSGAADPLPWPPRAFPPAPGETVWIAAVGQGSLRLRAADVNGQSRTRAFFSIAHKTNPGDSGSPVFNARGELIGIAVASMDAFGRWSVEVNPDDADLFHFRYRWTGRRPPSDLASTLVVDLTRIDWGTLGE